jgi:hypothetical protein
MREVPPGSLPQALDMEDSWNRALDMRKSRIGAMSQNRTGIGFQASFDREDSEKLAFLGLTHGQGRGASGGSCP